MLMDSPALVLIPSIFTEYEPIENTSADDPFETPMYVLLTPGEFVSSTYSQEMMPRIFVQEADWLRDAVQRLNSMRELTQNWNSYDSPPPSTLSVEQAEQFVEVLHELDCAANRVAPSSIGGVGITIRGNNGRRAYVEFRNNGQVFSMFSDGVADPRILPVIPQQAEYRRLVEQIEEYVHAASEAAELA